MAICRYNRSKPMNIPAIFTLFLTLATAVGLVSDRLRPDLIAMTVMIVLGFSGIITPLETFAGFSGSAVITLIGISIISEALHQTGVTHWLGQFMYRAGGTSEPRLILLTMLVAAGLSLFMNNIAAVGVLLPAVMTLSRQTRTSPARLLIPLAFGTSLGGMATLLTTSNIILSGALRDAGQKPFGLLDFFPIGAPLVLIGIVYMETIGRRLLPIGNPESKEEPALLRSKLANLYQLQKSIYELKILPGCPMAGHTISDGGWYRHLGINIVGFTHRNHTHFAPPPEQIIRTGDILLVQGDLDINRLPSLYLGLVRKTKDPLSITSETTILAEVIIAPRGSLIGQTLRQVRFRENYSLNVIGIWRGSKPILSRLADLPLRFGDALLVQGPADKIRLLNKNDDMVLLEEDPDAVYKPSKNRLALMITLLTLGIASFGSLPTAIVVMGGAVLLLLTRCLDMNDAYRGIEWKTIFLIAGMWPLSTAIRSTGLADGVVHTLFNLFGNISPIAAAAVLLFLALVLTQFLSGQVAALVLAPLAIAAATWVGADPRGLAMAVALGCSLSFPTPIGHPVNIMVMSPGGYVFRDFLRIGGPLTVLVFIAILFGLHFWWGL
jgi:di/tricarboxylate transporter